MLQAAVKDRDSKGQKRGRKQVQSKDTKRSRRAGQPLRERSGLQAYQASAALGLTQRQSAQYKHRSEHSKPVRAC